MREKEIEQILVNGIRRLGGRAYKWVSPGNNGVPDRIIILPGLWPVFVELKTEKGQLSAIQKVQTERLWELGQDVRVLYGLQEVDRFMEECERMVHCEI